MPESLELFGGAGAVSHGLGRQNDQQAVAVLVPAGDFERFGVEFRARVANDVNGIVMTPDGRKVLIELVHGLFGDLSQHAAGGQQCVGGQDAGAARVGNNSEAIALRTRLFA